METWQKILQASLTRPADVTRRFGIDPAPLEAVAAEYPMRINPYYLSLIKEVNDSIWRQAVPAAEELQDGVCPADPLEEENQSPVPNLVHRYPDRVLFLVCSECAMYCRFCTRKRKVGGENMQITRETIEGGLDYIRNHAEIRDVILSGGDPLLLADEKLDGILKALRAIPHVEIIRIGSRVPVVLPQRITPALVRVLRKYHPLYLNTHFNHPDEITEQAVKACARLADAGIPLGNQSVLLRGVNDDPAVMKRLMQKLLTIRVRPYYLYQADMVRGTNHFRTSVEEGLEIIRALRGHSSGLGVPAYVIDAPGGGGKIPLLPDYLQSLGEEVVLKNYLGDTYRYANVAPEVPEERRRVVNAQG
ncbi:KamA family radical SAM protein [Geoalkalibacter halelectricus]|uniref:KamA family radical SAM protein n=1 Tax=Geoalkalibacter halelectricus TaxID=2847045 RepID=A0ABY5ZN02_9BACT|nr:KamA family radical SAM protein [Geoalkalibacter halelectricus]MDO3378575.1 KamA family radical SAM protein [Geoalkalibacter halelectricus]UWZ80111.1 KamA family radical SAM protein [Geoalkalibacter halelectricus]